MANKNETVAKVPGRRIALLICNGTFAGYSLAGPSKDAELLESVLNDDETGRFAVHVLADAGLLEVRREIARICADASAADTLLLYYSGNGVTETNGSLYLLVADSDREFPQATAVDAEFILSQLRGSQCRQILLLIDCCYAGAFFNNNRGIPNGLYAITSCGANESCEDTPEGGAFTLAICAGLRSAAADADGDGRVSVDELHEFVKYKLCDEGYDGTPQKWVWNVPSPIYLASLPRHVFLSYAREDSAHADALSRALENEGLTVWLDRESVHSGNWKERVTEGLNRARAVVVLLSQHSLNSGAVRKELAFAANKDVPIIPVELAGLLPSHRPDWYTLDYEELHRQALAEETYAADVKRLAAAVRKLRKVPPTRVSAATSEAKISA